MLEIIITFDILDLSLTIGSYVLIIKYHIGKGITDIQRINRT